MSLGLVHVVDIILVLMTMEPLSVMLVLEDFREDSFGVLRLTILVQLSIVLDVHTSSVYSIELIFHLSRRPRRSLSTSCSWITASTLGYRRSINFYLGSWS